MMITKVADGAYFVPSYSVQTMTLGYSNETTQQALQTTQEDDNVANKDEIVPLDGNWKDTRLVVGSEL